MISRIGYLLVLVIAVGGFFVQSRLQSVFDRYSKETFASGMTGAEVAEKMLRDHGITDVTVTHTSGRLTDHFDPTDKTVNLSDAVYGSNSVAAAAVAAHECGHAVQHAEGYEPLKMRSALARLSALSAQFSTWAMLGGLGLSVVVRNSLFLWIGVGVVAVSALFSLVTLPVEYNASKRALAWLEGQEMLTPEQHGRAEEALTWAARTYVVAALSSIAVLLYYIGYAQSY